MTYNYKYAYTNHKYTETAKQLVHFSLCLEKVIQFAIRDAVVRDRCCLLPRSQYSATFGSRLTPRLACHVVGGIREEKFRQPLCRISGLDDCKVEMLCKETTSIF
jgi:hypothetical protein